MKKTLGFVLLVLLALVLFWRMYDGGYFSGSAYYFATPTNFVGVDVCSSNYFNGANFQSQDCDKNYSQLNQASVFYYGPNNFSF